MLYPRQDSIGNTSYSETISKIISNNCLECHSNANSDIYANGNRLEDYDDVKVTCDNGKLLSVLKHKPGFPKMPLGKDKLSDLLISQIEQWINEGAKNN